ncbi:hypothetical protein K469DRAFT_611907, partial [Zopfia rhizophila CBS 207.26]
FYILIKTLFDTLKIYIFNNKSLKNFTLDSRYIRLLYSITFSKAIYKFSYFYNKK